MSADPFVTEIENHFSSLVHAREICRIVLYNVIRAEAARTQGLERPELKMPPDDWGGTPVK